MSSGRLRALRQILAPSGLLLAVAIVGLFLGSYWQYVMAISLGAAVVGGALAMLVGYARCITLATGAMLAIGAYGATLPVVHLGGLSSQLWCLQRCSGEPLVCLGDTGGQVSQPQSRNGHLRFPGGGDHRAPRKQDANRGAEGIHVPPPVIFGSHSAMTKLSCCFAPRSLRLPFCPSGLRSPGRSARTSGRLPRMKMLPAPSVSTCGII